MGNISEGKKEKIAIKKTGKVPLTFYDNFMDFLQNKWKC